MPKSDPTDPITLKRNDVEGAVRVYLEWTAHGGAVPADVMEVLLMLQDDPSTLLDALDEADPE